MSANVRCRSFVRAVVESRASPRSATLTAAAGFAAIELPTEKAALIALGDAASHGVGPL